MITLKQITDQIDEATHNFGYYTFGDKGPGEVMDTQPIIDEIAKMSANDAGKLLKVLNTYEPKESTGATLASYIMSAMGDMPEDWFEEVLDISEVDY
jgi:hypothetical protein